MLTKLVAFEVTVRTFFADRLTRNESGASLVEYALLLALIAVVAIAALIFLGKGVNNTLNNIANNLANP